MFTTSLQISNSGWPTVSTAEKANSHPHPSLKKQEASHMPQNAAKAATASQKLPTTNAADQAHHSRISMLKKIWLAHLHTQTWEIPVTKWDSVPGEGSKKDPPTEHKERCVYCTHYHLQYPSRLWVKQTQWATLCLDQLSTPPPPPLHPPHHWSMM